jgi:hypothetical protein
VNPVTSFLVFACLVGAFASGYLVNPYLGLVFLAAAAAIAMSLKMANVWQKFVVLRMGKLQGVSIPWSPSSTGVSRPPPSTPSRH